MTRFVILVVCFIAITRSTIVAEKACALNELRVNCVSDCASDRCPKDETSDKAGCTDTRLCEPGCKCIVNHRRAANGTCIPTEKCPPFSCTRSNETYDPCPPYCPSDDCSSASPDGGCHIFGNIFILGVCYPACRCNKGYWRKDGVCVPYNQCFN